MFRWRFGGDPWTEMNRLKREMDYLVGALSTPRAETAVPMWTPARLFPLMNVVQRDNDFVVTAEIPGVKGDDLEINVEGDTLSLKGERKPEDPGANASYHRRERASGTFQRSLTLPRKIDAENVKASYQNGVLTVTLPIEKAELPKQISVSVD